MPYIYIVVIPCRAIHLFTIYLNKYWRCPEPEQALFDFFNIQQIYPLLHLQREYVIWLKEKFSVNPWISFQEPEVQEKLGELARKAGWPGQAMGVMSSFGSTKFTYYRNQIRSKLMGNKEVDVEGLSIKSLHNYLWKCFLPASTSLANPNREHLTLMLRSFCATEGRCTAVCLLDRIQRLLQCSDG